MVGIIAQRTSIPVLAVTRVWVNKKLVDTRHYDSTLLSVAASLVNDKYDSLTLMPGGPSQVPPATYENAVGTADAVAWRNVVAVAIDNLQLGGSKSLPLVEVEVITQGTPSTTDVVTRLRVAFDTASAVDSSYFNHTPTLTGPMTAGVGGVDTTLTTSLAELSYGSADLVAVQAKGWTLEAVITVDSQLWDSSYPNNVFVGYGYSSAYFQFRGQNQGVGTYYLAINSAPTGNVIVATGLYGAPTHVAIVRPPGATPTVRVYVNGTQVYTFTDTAMPANSVANVNVRHDANGFAPARRWVTDNIRLSYGEIYTGASFVPPTDLPAADGPATIYDPLPEDLQDIVNAELAMNPAIDLADHDTSDLAGTTVRGVPLVGPPANTIGQLGEAFYFDCVPGNPIRYMLRGQAVVGTIANADTGVALDQPGAAFAGLKRGNDVEVPSVVALRAPNASSDGEPVVERSDRGTTEGPDVRRVDTPVYFTPSEAKGRAISMALMARSSAHTASVSLSDKYAAAEPGDAYNITADDASVFNLLLRRLTYADGVKAAEWEHNDTSALVFSGITDTNYTPSLVVDAAIDSTLVPLDIPILRTADDSAGFYTAVEGSGSATYPGATVYRSPDDVAYTENIATHTSESVVGVAGAALGNFTGGYVWDDTSAVTVTLGGGQTLSSATESAMQADPSLNTAALGAHGRWEIIRFRTATLVSTGVYTLSGFLRGLLGTEDRISTHATADRFVLLTTAGLRRVDGEVSALGATTYLKAVTAGRPVTSATGAAFVNDGVALRMYSPTNLRAARDGSGNVTFSFDRRSRLQPRYGGSGGSYIPPAEAGETYEIDIYTTSGYATVVRTLTGATTSIAYSARPADHGLRQRTIRALHTSLCALSGHWPGRLLGASDMTMQQWASGDTAPWTKANENAQTLEHQATYGQRQRAHSGLTWGYYGGAAGRLLCR